MKTIAMVGAVCASLIFGSSAFAQVPSNPNNPNDNVPDGVPFTMPYGEPINLDTAKKVVAAAEAEAAKHSGWAGNFCFAVVGPSGDLVYFERGDNCQFASISISQHKARTSAKYRRTTLVFENLMGKGPYFSYLPTLDDVTASRGGNPIVMGGKIVGALGVSGGTGSQDNTLSLAGVAGVK